MKRKRNKFFTEQTEKRNVLDKAEYVVPSSHIKYLAFSVATPLVQQIALAKIRNY